MLGRVGHESVLHHDLRAVRDDPAKAVVLGEVDRVVVGPARRVAREDLDLRGDQVGQALVDGKER